MDNKIFTITYYLLLLTAPPRKVSSITLKKSSLLFLLVAKGFYNVSLNRCTWVHKMRKDGRHDELAFARSICQDTRIIGQTHAKQIYKIHDHN